MKAHANTNVTIAGTLDSKPVNYIVPTGDTGGVYIVEILNDNSYPAMAAGLQPNMRLVSINGTPIDSYAQFNDVMNGTKPGQNVTLGIIDNGGNQRNVPITLAGGAGAAKGYIGFSGYDLSDNSIGVSTGEFAQSYLNGLKNMPFTPGGWLRVMILPVLQFTRRRPGIHASSRPRTGACTSPSDGRHPSEAWSTGWRTACSGSAGST